MSCPDHGPSWNGVVLVAPTGPGRSLSPVMAARLLLLIGQVVARPDLAGREPRGWQEEACLPRNRGDANYECTPEGKIRCKDGWIGDLCQVTREELWGRKRAGKREK